MNLINSTTTLNTTNVTALQPLYGKDAVTIRIERGQQQFAWLLKTWHRIFDVPQKVSNDWALDPGIQHPTGPWASQMCGAFKGDGYNPKPGFFIGLEHFNAYLAGDHKGVQNPKTRDRLKRMTPLIKVNGGPLTAVDFYEIFCGAVFIDMTKPSCVVTYL